jgi:hypothetical protein
MSASLNGSVIPGTINNIAGVNIEPAHEQSACNVQKRSKNTMQ